MYIKFARILSDRACYMDPPDREDQEQTLPLWSYFFEM